MKLFTAIATAVVLGGSLVTTAVPASAQSSFRYYGGGYGRTRPTFNNPAGRQYRQYSNPWNNGSGGYGKPSYRRYY